MGLVGEGLPPEGGNVENAADWRRVDERVRTGK